MYKTRKYELTKKWIIGDSDDEESETMISLREIDIVIRMNDNTKFRTTNNQNNTNDNTKFRTMNNQNNQNNQNDNIFIIIINNIYLLLFLIYDYLTR